MKKLINYLLMTILLMLSLPSYALISSNTNPGSPEFLISACQEYTELYQKRDKPRLGAFLTTSKEESFRAGYCLGAILHTNDTCYNSFTRSVYRTAEIIASSNVKYSTSEARLLENARCL